MNYAILYILNPFVAVLRAFHVKNWSKLRNALWAFTVWFGITFAIGIETSNSDQARYFHYLESYHNWNWSLTQAIKNFNTDEQFDLARHFLLWGVSKFTDNGYVLMIVFSFILGFFFASNVSYVLNYLKNYTYHPPWYLNVLIIALVFAAPIDDIVGFRFITALHMALYGFLPLMLEGKKDKLWAVILSPILFHFSMWLFAFIVIGTLLFVNAGMRFPKIVLILFSLSCITSGFLQNDVVQLSRSGTDLPFGQEMVQQKSSEYWSDNNIEKRQSAKLIGGDRNWYATLYVLSLKWAVFFMLFVVGYISLFKKRIIFSKYDLKAFILLLMILIVLNAISGLPGVNRFDALINFLGLSYLLNFAVKYSRKTVRSLVKFTLPALLLFIIVSFRAAIYNVSDMTVIGSPLIGVFTVGQNIPLNEALKSLLGYL